MEDLQPSQKHFNLTHYQQQFNWDCGISCIIMILSSSQKENLLQNFDKICKEEKFGASTWTIDLCYLLQRYNVRHAYYTKTLGIDPNYTTHSYYKKIIDTDEKRVIRRFKDAKAQGLHVEQRLISFDSIIWHLSKNGPVILLTNASLLTCDICKQNVLEKFGYAGHYIVLCGYDMKVKKVFYRNPEVRDNHICRCGFESMDTARKAYGTDEDVILIYQN